jgi:hypothetical protein
MTAGQGNSPGMQPNIAEAEHPAAVTGKLICNSIFPFLFLITPP